MFAGLPNHSSLLTMDRHSRIWRDLVVWVFVGWGGGGVKGTLKNAYKVNKRQCGHMLSPSQTFTSVLITYI